MSMREAFDIFFEKITGHGSVLGELSQGFPDAINIDKVLLSLQKMINLTNWNGNPNFKRNLLILNLLKKNLVFLSIHKSRNTCLRTGFCL